MEQMQLDRPAPIDPNGQIFFIHIPKCAGTSLNERLAKQVDEDLVIRSSEHPIATMAEEPKELFTKARLMSGHFPEVVRRMYMPEAQAITGLRDPVKRLRSLVAHGARGIRFRGWMAPFYDDHDVSFLQTKEAQYKFTLRTSQLAYLTPESLAIRPMDSEFVTDQDIKDAIATLQNCACVYTDESFDKFSRALGGLFCDPPVEKTERLNTAKKKEPWLEAIDFEALAAHLCPWDVYVYREAERRAAETLAALGSPTNAEEYAAWWQDKPQLDQFTVDFGAPYKSHGLGIRRKLPPALANVTNARRMVELAESSAYLDVRRPANSTEIEILLAGRDCTANPPVISCDGIELKSTATRVLGGVMRHAAKLPPAKDNAPPYLRVGLTFKQPPQSAIRGHLVSVAFS